MPRRRGKVFNPSSFLFWFLVSFAAWLRRTFTAKKAGNYETILGFEIPGPHLIRPPPPSRVNNSHPARLSGNEHCSAVRARLCTAQRLRKRNVTLGGTSSGSCSNVACQTDSPKAAQLGGCPRKMGGSPVLGRAAHEGCHLKLVVCHGGAKKKESQGSKF